MADPLDDAVAQLRTARQVAELFGVSPTRVRYLAHREGVGHWVGDYLLFTPADVEAIRPRSGPGPEAKTTRWLRRRNQI